MHEAAEHYAASSGWPALADGQLGCCRKEDAQALGVKGPDEAAGEGALAVRHGKAPQRPARDDGCSGREGSRRAGQLIIMDVHSAEVSVRMPGIATVGYL